MAKDASARIVDLLATSGVRLQVWHLPAELAEQHDGPVISLDDLLDFHLLLQSEEWFEDLAEQVARSVDR